jgi:hypothetical protein
MLIMDKLSDKKLATIVDTIFDGLSGPARGADGVSGLRAACARPRPTRSANACSTARWRCLWSAAR